jgi:hypothetical protein
MKSTPKKDDKKQIIKVKPQQEKQQKIDYETSIINAVNKAYNDYVNKKIK